MAGAVWRHRHTVTSKSRKADRSLMAQVFRHRKMNTAFGYFIGNVALVSVALVHLCPTLCLGWRHLPVPPAA